MRNLSDVVIAGAGPAGLAAASALARRGLAVTVVDPRAGEPWKPVYGGWADEYDALGLGDLASKRWPAAQVYTPSLRTLNRPYMRVDGDRVRRRLEDQLSRRGGRLVSEAVTAVHRRPGGLRVEATGGMKLTCGLVIDASGASGLSEHSATAWQVAYGVELEVSGHPWGSDMLLMDWRSASSEGGGPPSFLYAMPHSRTRVFVEETVLATRELMPPNFLRPRLDQRLACLGLTVRSRGRVELCRIPLDVQPSRVARPGVVPFGAAAGMIHPISGYQLARCLRLAEPLSHAIAAELGSGGHGDRAVEAARLAVSSPPAARRHLDLLGLGVLVCLDRDQAQRFFTAFFDMAPTHQRAWLDADRSSTDVLVAMATMFRGLSSPMKRALLRESTRHVGQLLSANFQAEVPHGHRY